MTDSRSIVVITADGPEHIYVTNVICAHFDVAAIFVLEPSPSNNRFNVWRRGIGTILDKLMWRALLFALNDRKARKQALHSVLGHESLAFAQSGRVVRVRADEREKLTASITDIAPDILAVYGTGKIPNEILNLADQVALNMHTGISPYYRGTACAFWPIVDNNAELVGATVHECTAAMDGGKIFFSGKARLYRHDSLHMIFARAVKVGAQAYVEVLKAAMDGTLEGKAQDLSIGREYRGYMRGFRAEILARRNLRRMRKFWSNESSGASQK